MVSKKGLISLFLTLSSIAVGQSSNGPIESGLQPICDVPSDLDLSGSWHIGSRPTYIEQSGDFVVFINERGERSRGSFDGNGTVIASDWFNLHGRVSVEHDRISWANGTVWERNSIQKIIFQGDICSQGRGYCVADIRSSSALTLTNEHGETSTASISEGRVYADQWRQGGHVMFQFCKIQAIYWDNGDVWH